MSTNSPTIHCVAQRAVGQVCKLLPAQARQALLSAGTSMQAINAAHRFARAMCPQHFNMDDTSFSVKEPKASDGKE